MSDNRFTIILGDVHKEFKRISHQIKLKKISDCDIIQVGDFGLGFSKSKEESNDLNNLNKVLKERNINLFVIRGNHDDPSRFSELKNEFSNILILPDYSVFELNGKTYLSIGGAISVDRKERVEFGNIWFPDERVVYDEEKLKGHDLSKIDILLTHTAPNRFVQHMIAMNVLDNLIIEDKMINWKDYSLLGECIHEQISLDLILDQLPNITQAYFGHFHKSYSNFSGRIMYHLVDIHEMKEVR